jgi:hypothetical protein
MRTFADRIPTDPFSLARNLVPKVGISCPTECAISLSQMLTSVPCNTCPAYQALTKPLLYLTVPRNEEFFRNQIAPESVPELSHIHGRRRGFFRLVPSFQWLHSGFSSD